MTTIGEAVAQTGARSLNGWEPLIVTIDKAGKTRNQLLSTCADRELTGAVYMASALFDPVDIEAFKGRTKENCKRILWLPFDFDLSEFVGLPKDRIWEWQQQHIDDVVRALVEEVRRIFEVMGLSLHRVEYTGYGIAAYTYLPKHGPESIAEYQKIHAILVERINVLAGAPLADTQVSDAGSRIMRLVPSVNEKGAQSRVSYVIDFVRFGDAPVTLEQLREIAGDALNAPDQPIRIIPLSGEVLPAATVDELIRLLMPEWKQGSRHAIALGLSGMLAKAGVPEAQARAIVERLAAGDDEFADRMKAVGTSYSRVRSGQDVGGFYSLRKMISDELLTWIDALLADIRKATSPRLVIGERASREQITIGKEEREFEYLPIPDSALVGWIAEYTAMMLPTTEAPAAFHYAVGMTLAGSTIGRHVGTIYAADVLYPNIFALIVGRSGRSRKDTAIKRAIRMLTQPMSLSHAILRPDATVCTDVASAEGLLKVMSENNANVLLYLTEFSRLMGNAARKGTTTIIPTLMELFDMPPVVANLNKASPIVVKNPVLSILAATQPEILADLMRSQDIASGFANRWFYACGDGQDAIPIPPELDWKAVTLLYKRLLDAVEPYKVPVNADGEPTRPLTVLRLDADASRYWEAWYTSDFNRPPLGAEEDAMRIRHAVLIMKLAIIYAVTDQASTISVRHLEPAVAAVSWMWRHVEQLMTTWGQRLDNEIEAKMLNVLERRGNMPKRDLYKLCRNRKWTSPEMGRVYESLVKSDAIKVDPFGIVGINGDE